MELEEKNLNKEIDDFLLKIMELEQKWLREQNELVRLIQERQRKQVEVKSENDNFVVLTTKKMRIEKNIETEQTNIRNLNKNLDHLRLQLEKLNKYIFKENNTRIELQKSLELASNDYVEKVKEAERDTIKLQTKISEIKNEKEQALLDLIEVE